MNTPTALQRCDIFVGRTMNWLYDHFRMIPRYSPLVLCDRLSNRSEFPELEAWEVDRRGLPARAWRRLMRDKVYPPLHRRLARAQPRVLHSHFGYVAVEDFSLHRSLAVPWIVGFYGADVYAQGKSSQWLDRYATLFDRAELVLALGPAMATALARLGCPASKIEVHALGVDVDSIPHNSRRLKPGESLRILYAGTFREKKGVEYLVHAVHLARSAGVPLRLDLVGDAAARPGDAETKAAIFGLIHKYDLTDHIVHHSWLGYEDLIRLALDAHVFAAPSVTASDGDSEGTPFVIQQMMATGMPVISTKHSDIPFLFGEHEALLIPERDAGAISTRIQRYFDEPDRIPTEGAAMREQMRGHFNVRERAAALAGIYDRLGDSMPES